MKTNIWEVLGMQIKVGIMGVTGYTGRELLRLLLNHPFVEIEKVFSRSNVGNDITRAHPHLMKLLTLVEDDIERENIAQGLDVAFLALPHGKSASLAQKLYEKGIKVIDLGADFRLNSLADYESWYELEHPCPDLLAESVYGLPEIYKEKIKESRIIANPGCY